MSNTFLILCGVAAICSASLIAVAIWVVIDVTRPKYHRNGGRYAGEPSREARLFAAMLRRRQRQQSDEPDPVGARSEAPDVVV